jgi:hypothetical protein
MAQMIATFPSTCDECWYPIYTGDPIFRVARETVHVDCAAAERRALELAATKTAMEDPA